MSKEENLGSDVPRMNVMESVKQGVKNVMDTSILKPVTARVRQRMKELKQLSSARIEKIQRGNHKQFITTPPEMFIVSLDAVIRNGIGTITYSVFETEKNKNGELVKKMEEHIVERITEDGRKVKMNASSKYVVKEDVIETIEYRKPIKIERFEGVN